MKSQNVRECQTKAKKIVVKVGTSTLTRDGKPRAQKFGKLAESISRLLEADREVVLVSSGAVAMGSQTLGWSGPGKSIPEKQAAAAIGQIELVEVYRRRFAKFNKHVGQVLLTRSGLEDRERFLNARHTLQTLLRLGTIPIVNENDTVATEEIRFGDNDNLSSAIVNLVGADLLVILTDVDGLYERRPVPGQKKSKLISLVEHVTPEIEAAAKGSASAFAQGGMITKLEAAKSAAHSGAATVLCNGRNDDMLERIVAGEEVGTLFLPGPKMSSRKHWLAFTASTHGTLVIDSGAATALRTTGSSLLPKGVLSVEGQFGIGEPIVCTSQNGEEIARGLPAYGADEIRRIKGCPTGEITGVLGYSNGDEIIHRDDLVTLDH